ncbi:hypothetical protein FACS18942_08580 [Planctomycetales bacterium]|nr:hypothetical protein FACS18942_08580 [Planctomycetales bacterium]
MPKKTLKTSIPVHAKERLIERYDIKFSRKQENEFCRSLGGRNTVSLGGKRCAVYFDGTWFLLTLEHNGTVSTFLSPAMLKPDEKTLLKKQHRLLQHLQTER